MNEARAVELIAERIVAQWPTLSGGLPLALPDEAMPSAASFAQLTIIPTTSEQLTMGPRPRFRYNGRIMIKLWAPAASGAATITALCDVARTIYQHQQLDPGDGTDVLTIQSGTTQVLPSDAAFAMRVVSFVYYYFDQP